MLFILLTWTCIIHVIRNRWRFYISSCRWQVRMENIWRVVLRIHHYMFSLVYFMPKKTLALVSHYWIKSKTWTSHKTSFWVHVSFEIFIEDNSNTVRFLLCVHALQCRQWEKKNNKIALVVTHSGKSSHSLAHMEMLRRMVSILDEVRLIQHDPLALPFIKMVALHVMGKSRENATSRRSDQSISPVIRFSLINGYIIWYIRFFKIIIEEEDIVKVMIACLMWWLFGNLIDLYFIASHSLQD